MKRIRPKKKNPTEYELLKTFKIKKKDKYLEQGEIIYVVLSSTVKKFNFENADLIIKSKKVDQKDLDKLVAIAVFDIYSKNIQFIEVDKKFQRNGIASWLYDYIEQDLRIKLTPSEILTIDGEDFWNYRLRKK